VISILSFSIYFRNSSSYSVFNTKLAFSLESLDQRKIDKLKANFVLKTKYDELLRKYMEKDSIDITR